MFHITMELDSKPLPVMVIVAALPVGTTCGEMDTIAGMGLLTVKVAAGDVPPPGAGFWTEIPAVLLPERLAAGRVAFSWVLLTNVVASAVLFHCATELDMNPEPESVITVSDVPAVTEVGVILETSGKGLPMGGGVVEPEEPPPQPEMRKANRQVRRTHLKEFMCTLDKRILTKSPRN